MEENSSTLLRRLVVKQCRDGRRGYDVQAKQELVEACLQPGISVAKLAYEHAINPNLLRKWILQYQRQQGESPAKVMRVPAMTSTFIPVMTVNTQALAIASTLRARLVNGIEFDANCASRDDVLSLLQMLCQLPCSASTRG